MIFYDISKISKRKKTPEGFLKVPARVARTGVQDYDSFYDFEDGELPDEMDRKPGKIVRLLRPENQVFSDQTMASVVNKPITDGHPSESVNAANVRDLQVGFSKENVKRDDNAIAVDLLIQAKDAIEKIEKDGVNQISLGYATDVVWDSGIDDEFGPYDGIQTAIEVNHIALVRAGRAGPEIRLSDSENKRQKEKNKMATRMIDGITIEVTDQAGEAIDKLTSELTDTRAELETVKTELVDSKKETESVKGELDAEKAKVLNTEKLDELVNARLAVIDKARKLAPKIETKGLSDTEIRKAAIEATSKDFDLKDKSDEYVAAVFDTLCRDIKGESSVINDDLKNLDDGSVSKLDEARDRMRKNRASGGKE
ncbi:DUF2213 domain-containing protein [candidate division KSB1 bacterium]|nr:DUF2213 domain-containing protein [candidate division KSB1 bacterium]